MSLILASHSELVIGEPTPWPLYDAAQTLLLGEGEIVRDEQHRDALLASGACHAMSWDTPNGEPPPLMTAEAEAERRKDDSQYTFDDMKLRVEDKLQLEPPVMLSRERLLVKVIGFIRGVSLLVTTPTLPNGQRLQIMENEKVIMRSFSGKNAFAFASTVMKVNRIPYDYLHLTFPDNIQGLAIRKTARVKTRIIAAVQNSTETGEQVSAIISDISATGVSLETKRRLGEKGDVLSLAFRVQLHNVEALLSVKGVIRAVLSDDSTDIAKLEYNRYGIELQDLQPNDSVILQSMIYQQMIENPQKLV